jgi:hypothetical protein
MPRYYKFESIFLAVSHAELLYRITESASAASAQIRRPSHQLLTGQWRDEVFGGAGGVGTYASRQARNPDFLASIVRVVSFAKCFGFSMMCPLLLDLSHPIVMKLLGAECELDHAGGSRWRVLDGMKPVKRENQIVKKPKQDGTRDDFLSCSTVSSVPTVGE